MLETAKGRKLHIAISQGNLIKLNTFVYSSMMWHSGELKLIGFQGFGEALKRIFGNMAGDRPENFNTVPLPNSSIVFGKISQDCSARNRLTVCRISWIWISENHEEAHANSWLDFGGHLCDMRPLPGELGSVRTHIRKCLVAIRRSGAEISDVKSFHISGLRDCKVRDTRVWFGPKLLLGGPHPFTFCESGVVPCPWGRVLSADPVFTFLAKCINFSRQTSRIFASCWAVGRHFK